jgi:hypothetical protein
LWGNEIEIEIEREIEIEASPGGALFYSPAVHGGRLLPSKPYGRSPSA